VAEGYAHDDDDEYSQDDREFFARATHNPKTGLAVDRSVPGRTTVKLSNRTLKPMPDEVKSKHTPAKNTGRNILQPRGSMTMPRFDSDRGITESPNYKAMFNRKLMEMGVGSVASAPMTPNAGAGTLFGGSYSQKNSPFAKKQTKKRTGKMIKR
jgi:hypothetical protein